MATMGRRTTARFLLCIAAAAASAACHRDPPYLAFVDRAGQVRIRLQPGQRAGSFSEGLAAVTRGDAWGYIDTSGRFVIPPRFGSADQFSEDRALVTLAPQDKYWDSTTLFGYIDRSGEFAIQPVFNWARSFAEGLAPVCTGTCRGLEGPRSPVGYVDRTGRYALAPRWGSAGEFSEGRAWVSDLGAPILSRRTWLMQRSGEPVSGDRFGWAHPFSHGLAATDRGFVDRAGKVRIERSVAGDGDGFSDGWAAVLEAGKAVFIDTTGQVVLRPGYQSVGSYSEGLAPACRSDCGPSGGKRSWGFMDKTGRFVIPPQFGYRPRPFREGLALVCFGCEG